MPRRHPPHIGPNQWLLTLGVFLIFGPVGVFIGLLQQQPPGWLFSLVLSALSGLLAVGWSFSLNKRGWWLLMIVPLIGAPIFVFPWLFGALFEGGLLTAGYEWSEIARKVFAVVWGTVSMSLGFTSVIYYVTRAERVAAKAEAELEAARSIHEQLVPPIDLEVGGLQILGRSHASASMGGDLVDLVRHGEDGPIDVLLGDVSGHGIRAGAVMAMAKGALRARGEGAAPIGDVLRDVNRQLERLTDDAMFLTLTLVRIEPPDDAFSGRRVTLGLAGHHGALLLQDDGVCEQVGEESGGLPLGVMPEVSYETHSFDLRPGGLLTLYTDGLSEVGAGRSGGMLGAEGVARVILEASRRASSLERIHEHVMASVHAAGAQDDDQSLVMIRVASD